MLDYWWYPEEGERHFTFSIHDEPVGELRRVFEAYRPAIPYYAIRQVDPTVGSDHDDPLLVRYGKWLGDAATGEQTNYRFDRSNRYSLASDQVFAVGPVVAGKRLCPAVRPGIVVA